MIISKTNTQIKMIRKLRDKKYRHESGLFFLEGIRIVLEALEHKEQIHQLIVSRELLTNSKAIQAVDQAKEEEISVLDVSAEVFSTLSDKNGPQGLAAVAYQKWLTLSDLDGCFSGIWIALHQVADPGNLGTIIRTLDGMNGKGVILLDNCTDPYDPSSIRASMGAIFGKGLLKTTSTNFIKWNLSRGIPLIGATDAAKNDYHDYPYPKNMILLMGSEREGIPPHLQESCLDLVAIPMLGQADSLNLSVASSIILYAILQFLKK